MPHSVLAVIVLCRQHLNFLWRCVKVGDECTVQSVAGGWKILAISQAVACLANVDARLSSEQNLISQKGHQGDQESNCRSLCL